MKKTVRMMSIFLSVVLLVASLPTVLAQTEKITPLYDNSFMVTVETTSKLDLVSYLGVHSCGNISMVMYPTYITYQTVAIVLDETVQEAINRVQSLPGVVEVKRNTSAKDYWQKASYVTLGENTIAIPVGETKTVTITGARVAFDKYSQVGIEVMVDGGVFTYEQFCDALTGVDDQLMPLALYEHDLLHALNKPYRIYWHYNGPAHFAGPELERKDTQSPINRYLLIWKNGKINQEVAEKLSSIYGIYGVKDVYWITSDNHSFNQWETDVEGIADISAFEDECGLLFTVSITGKEEGETLLTVRHSGIGESLTATCFVKVYEPNWGQPKGFGDANADGKIDAKDALAVLRYSVHPHLHFGTITKDNVMEYEKLVWQMETVAAVGEVDGLQGINAKDALQILKYAVKKIDRFPVEDMVTPTDI